MSQKTNKQIGYIGLGKMGLNMVRRLRDKKWQVVAYNRSPDPHAAARRAGARLARDLPELVSRLNQPRLVWVMVSHQAVDQVLDQLVPLLSAGDLVIDGGNSPFAWTIKRAARLGRRQINFLDVGVSGGPGGARNGACCMIGGERAVFKRYESLFRDISVKNGYGYMGRAGAGHFVKMVHNGIEYGMMQAIGEGFAILQRSNYQLDLKQVSNLYNHASVIESRLIGWLAAAYKKHGPNLSQISGQVSHSGEGQWTVDTAKTMGIPAPIIEGALKFRIASQKCPSYTGRVVSALRNQFGGHAVSKIH